MNTTLNALIGAAVGLAFGWFAIAAFTQGALPPTTEFLE
jgi:hypothetical protein